MGTRTSYPSGTFCWVDLSTGDLHAAIAFYQALLGWRGEVEETPGGGLYGTFLLEGRRVAGVFAGKRTEWLSYVSVEDVEASAERAEELGADVLAGPRDVGDLGRVAYLTDPLGAAIGLWQPGSVHGAETVNDPGAFSWSELVCPNLAVAQDFYERLFGWGWHEVLGSRNPYRVIINGERSNGGIMQLPDAEAHWRPYFVVEGCDASAARAAELGGRVIFEPQPVPAGRMSVLLDPQDAIFCLFEGEVDD